MSPRRPDPSDLLPLAPDALLILLALASAPLHGYGIMRDVEARSDGRAVLQSGALYRMLRRLLGDGLVGECPPPPDAASEDERRRYYELTPFGRSVLDAEVARMAALVRAARLTGGGKKPRLI